jgi:glycosyltransferase involved in cell wall biosynthesis
MGKRLMQMADGTECELDEHEIILAGLFGGLKNKAVQTEKTGCPHCRNKKDGEAMKLSIIISILNSQEIVRRQLLHFEKMALPDDVEIIFIDDGSDPPLDFTSGLKNLRTHATNDKRAWTVELARNCGARMARGEYLLMTDIDYIIPLNAIEAVYTLKEDKCGFRRELGVLDEQGNLTQDFDVLRQYGLLESRIKERGTKLPPHPNNFIMRKTTFFQIGGYREDRVGVPYPNGGDRWFKRAWAAAFEKGQVTLQDPDLRKTLYMFPNGQFCGDVDYNPFGLFHNLSRKSERNPVYARMSG